MRGLALARLSVLALAIVLSAMVTIGQPSVLEPRLAVSIAPAVPSSPPPDVTSPTAGWDLDADIGSVMVASWRASLPWSTVRPLLVNDRIGSVLLFTPNFGGTAAGMRGLSDRLTALAQAQCLDYPILTMLDEEGGSVANVQAPFAPPWPLQMASYGPDRVRALEAVNGAGLRSAGVGLNLAPVADVRTNYLDGVIGARSFGSSPSVVAPLVASAVAGLHDGGVGATLKHFPGLGGAPGDPHEAIPTDRESEAAWSAVQMPSFAAGIAAGADAVMVTAVYVPGLGAGSMPAMFSPAVVGRLRSQLGFTGVIVTDSLSMGGVTARWSLPEAAVLAVAAGNDLVMLGNGDPSYEAQAVAAVRSAVRSGRLDWTRIHESAMRVNALRERWGRRIMPCRAPVGE